MSRIYKLLKKAESERINEMLSGGKESCEKMDINEIKKGDWVDVNYTAAGGKNTARVVSVEKEEPAADETAPAAEG